MTDFVLRWKIDNATATLATGKAESDVFIEGGFEWIGAVERIVEEPNDMAQFTLRCDVGHNGQWECEAEVGLSVLHVGGTKVFAQSGVQIVPDAKYEEIGSILDEMTKEGGIEDEDHNYDF
ncbi:hypothetical protein PENTCL1PPCAC_3824, partial [Pristionchus entomophagus]